MGHSFSRGRRHHHHQTPSLPPTPPTTTATNTITDNTNTPQDNPIPSPLPPPPPPPRSYAFAANAPYPPLPLPPPPPPHMASSSDSRHLFNDPHLRSFYFSSIQRRRLRPAIEPPPYVDHQSAKKIKNDVNVHRDTIKLAIDQQSLDTHLISFTFDAVVDGSITIFYFAKEGSDCMFTPLYPEVYMPRRIPFQKGLGQKFSQPSGTGIDLGFFELDDLSNASPKEDVFPLVIYVEPSLPSSSVGTEPEQPLLTMSSHAQITLAVLEKNNEGHFQVKVIKQILWIDGVRYELREIYGIDSPNEAGFDDSEPGKECAICMTEPKDTAVLPCRHMCMCSNCAKELRLRSNKCPICREPIRALIEIKGREESS